MSVFSSDISRRRKLEWVALAEHIYRERTNNYQKNLQVVKRALRGKQSLTGPVLLAFPNIEVVIAHMIVVRFGFSASTVNWCLGLDELTEEDCRKAGRSFATYTRSAKTGLDALLAWKANYTQLYELDEFEGVEDFFLSLANYLIYDSVYGMVLRVGIGAIVGMVNVATDVLVLWTYSSSGLHDYALALLAMILGSITVQIFYIFVKFKKTNFLFKLKEAAITLLFLRPTVDAFRVCTNEGDAEISVNPLMDMTINKGIELGCVGIPGCIMQIYVFLAYPEQAGSFALSSIVMSSVATGMTCALISFDVDVNHGYRLFYPEFYGYIPDDFFKRNLTFVLMTFLSTVHNISRSFGVAILAHLGKYYVLAFTAVEMCIFLFYKLYRSDFVYWLRLEGWQVLPVSFLIRVLTKVVADFSGCIHLRHPHELGAIPFLICLAWAQVMPFVALALYSTLKETQKTTFDIENLGNYLPLLFFAWLFGYMFFFLTIDLSYLDTFIHPFTGAQYNAGIFRHSDREFVKFEAAFGTHPSYTRTMKAEIFSWVKKNIERWMTEREIWFDIAMIPHEFISKEDVERSRTEAPRRKSSYKLSSYRLWDSTSEDVKYLMNSSILSTSLIIQKKTSRKKTSRLQGKEPSGTEAVSEKEVSISATKSLGAITSVLLEWERAGDEVYALSFNNHVKTLVAINRMFEQNEDMFEHALELCPNLSFILCYALEDRFGWNVGTVVWTKKLNEYSRSDCKKVGRALSTFVRLRKTGNVAVDAWRLHYPMLKCLFEEVPGFTEFMVSIACNKLTDSIYGLVWRVSIGAVISILDAVTDLYVTVQYLGKGLTMQAAFVLCSVYANILAQLLIVISLRMKHSIGRNSSSSNSLWREMLISLFFIRPAFDAYRVCKSKKGHTEKALSAFMFNKGCELATESIPGCILQIFVWITRREEAGRFALASILVSASLTGFTSAQMAFDLDVDDDKRAALPSFYGLIPDDYKTRSICFKVMVVIGTLHNLSRSLGCALLAIASVKLCLLFVAGEVALYVCYKAIRRDLLYFPRFTGLIALVVSIVERVLVKIVVDFSGCMHFRHGYEMGGLAYSISMIWAQVFPFVALRIYRESDEYVNNAENLIEPGRIMQFLVCSLLIWTVLVVFLLLSINPTHIRTFVTLETSASLTRLQFLTSRLDSVKFGAAFGNRMEYKRGIEDDIRSWVSENIDVWRRARPDWFEVEMIPDEYLPVEVLEMEGGKGRRRSTVSLGRLLGGGGKIVPVVHPEPEEEEEEG